MPITFDKITQNLIKLAFLDSSRQDLSNDLQFDWFLGRPHFFIVFGNDIISCHMVFKSAYFVEFTEVYQPAKLQFYRLSGSRFSEELQKHNDDVIMMSFHTFGIQNFNIL